MLNTCPHRQVTMMARRAQAGMVMIVALIILIAMTLGGLALVRSTDTANLIAGNMAFQQAATHSADSGVEAAIAWLEGVKMADEKDLEEHIPAAGYAADATPVPANQTGEAFWIASSAAGVCFLPMAGGACSAAPGVANAAGNTVSFMIQRLCGSTGTPTGNDCAVAPGGASASPDNLGDSYGDGESIGPGGANTSTAVYYRITVRVSGPRNTLSFVQATVSM
jgi:type IV pilus assembly protein PilX